MIRKNFGAKALRRSALVWLTWLASGCLSMQSPTTIDNIQQAATTGSQPYVEAYVEYRGPSDKWAGPTTFLLHVVAKDAGVARVSITPALFGAPAKDAPNTAGRGLASKGMAGETARDHMARLALSVQGGDIPFRGCLSPVRVRLVRADGALLEKSGCRSGEGWPRAASEAVNQFIVSTVGAGA